MSKPKPPVPNQPNIIQGPLAILLNSLVLLLVVLAIALGWMFSQPGAALPIRTPLSTATDALGLLPEIVATPTISPPCNWAALVADINIKDGNTLKAAEKFTKTWRLRNIGTCTWSADYELVYIMGRDMSGPQTQRLGVAVTPGNTIDLALELTAPLYPGDYVATYKLRSADGVEFGLDFDFDQPLWVAITVTE